MKVYINNKEFKVIVKENDKKDIVLNANIDVFNYLSKESNFLLGALDILNGNNSDYFNNTISYLGNYFYIPNISYSYNSYEVSLNNNITLQSAPLTNLPTNGDLQKIALQLKKTANISPFTIYEIKKLEDVALVCILHYSRYGYTIKKCKNCNKWFIPKTTKETKFCYRKDIEYTTMNCADAYKYKERLKRVANDEIYSLHKKVYNSLRNRMIRTKDIEKEKDAEKHFNLFKEENQIKVNLLKQNKLSEEDYIIWLKSQTNKKSK